MKETNVVSNFLLKLQEFAFRGEEFGLLFGLGFLQVGEFVLESGQLFAGLSKFGSVGCRLFGFRLELILQVIQLEQSVLQNCPFLWFAKEGRMRHQDEG